METIIFPQPDQVLVEKVDDYCSIFTLKPLDKGYGITLGNGPADTFGASGTSATFPVRSNKLLMARS